MSLTAKDIKDTSKLLDAPEQNKALPEGIHARRLHAGPHYSQKS
jgi:hypothetical protein